MFTPLSVKTLYSEADSIIDIEMLVKRASQLGFQAIGIADFDNVFKINTFCEYCKHYDIKPIIGSELKLNDTNLIIIVKNQTGYYNLMEIILHKDNDNLDFNTILKYQEGLAFIFPMENMSIIGKYKYKYKLLNQLKEIYLEIRRDTPHEIALNQEFITIAKKILHIKPIANTKITHLQKDTFKMFDTIKKSKRPELSEYFYSGTYLKVPNEYEGFMQEAIQNNQNLVNSIQEIDVDFNNFGDKFEELKSKVEPKFQNYIKNFEDFIQENLKSKYKKELKLIKTHNLSGYFLELEKLAKDIKNIEFDTIQNNLVLALLLDIDVKHFANKFYIPQIVIPKDFDFKYLEQKYNYKFFIKYSAITQDKNLDFNYYIKKVGKFLNIDSQELEYIKEEYEWNFAFRHLDMECICVEIDDDKPQKPKKRELKINLTNEEELYLFINQIMELQFIQGKKHKLLFKEK